MKSLLTKKVIIIFSVLIVIVLSAILLAYATGNTRIPSLTDPDGVFYERLDDNGDVIYTITNQELFEEIKGNDGLDQALLLVDSYLLTSYLDQLTDEEIQDKISELKYGTSDPDELALLDDETKASYEEAYNQSMILAGYVGKEEEFASIVLAREVYTRYIIDFNGDVTDMDVAAEYVSNYFEDIQAIKIRFTSSVDAADVMQKYNLLTYNLLTLRQYLGYIFTNEALLDNEDNVVEAYTTVNPYYFDESNNILTMTGTIVYTLGEGNIYTDASSNEYSLDQDGNLLNIDLDVVIANNLLFSSVEDATTYKEANTEYFTVSKVDAFDMEEDAVVINSLDEIVYTIDADGVIYNTIGEDVTDTTNLIVNKVFTEIANVNVTSLNNSSELTAQEVLDIYIEIYNYVYSGYRDALPENATVEDLLALDNEYLTFTYEDVYATQTSLATYMFNTLDLSEEDALPYSVSAKAYAGANDNSYYLVYKLAQQDKVDAYDIMLDYIESHIAVPTTVASDITLPTTDWYDAKIVWYSSNSSILASDGTYTAPSEDTEITLTYSITANSTLRTGTILVNVLASGTTSSVTENTDEQVSFETILNDETLYQELYNQLIDDMVYGTNAETNITDYLNALRVEYNFTLYDPYVQVDYQQTFTDYVINENGDKVTFLSVTGRPGDEEALYEVSADDFFTYVMTKNPSLYIIYAAQVKELIYSTYFIEVFGEETDLSKNDSSRMEEMYQSVQDSKDYYAYLESLYTSYGMVFTYSSFAEYSYLQYGTKTEASLLTYFVQSTLQPYLINEAISNYDLVNILYPSVEEYYNNYFSLNVTHVVIYVDLNEDGNPDDYFDYTANLSETELSDFETLLAGLEVILDDYTDYATAVTDYENATRDDETWGVFKQAGIYLLSEDLNQVDDNDVSHSLTYTGEYGVKDTYVSEYTDELIRLYQEYSLEQNLDLEDMVGTVTTEFGYHIILVTQGDDFTRPSAAFTEVDSANPEYTDGSENESDMPSYEQALLYAQYFFYSTVYDLSDADIESRYNITVPALPATVTSALEVCFDAQLQEMYVLGTINVVMADRLVDGNFVDNDYCTFTESELLAQLAEVKSVYYEALYGPYITE